MTIIIIIIAVFIIVAIIKFYPYGTSKFTGGARSKKNVLIVDILNVFSDWYFTKFKTHPPHKNQTQTYKLYIRCMEDHHDNFRVRNVESENVVHYVLKNLKKYSKHKVKSMTKEHKKLFEDFAKSRNVRVSIAYSTEPIRYSQHYEKGRDDKLLFHLADEYTSKKSGVRKVMIMSNDKFADFDDLSKVNKFEGLHFPARVYKSVGKKIYDRPLTKPLSSYIVSPSSLKLSTGLNKIADRTRSIWRV